MVNQANHEMEEPWQTIVGVGEKVNQEVQEEEQWQTYVRLGTGGFSFSFS